MPVAAKRLRQVRAVSMLTPARLAMTAVGIPRAANSTINARTRSRNGVLCPRARFFSRCRSAAVTVIGQAGGPGIGNDPFRD